MLAPPGMVRPPPVDVDVALWGGGPGRKSWKPKALRKNQYVFTIVHVQHRMDAIFKNSTLILEARSAMTHFIGGVMGSNADFKEIGLAPEE